MGTFMKREYEWALEFQGKSQVDLKVRGGPPLPAGNLGKDVA